MRFVLAQLYDIRHRKASGELDLERMRAISAVVNLRPAFVARKAAKAARRIAPKRNGAAAFAVPVPVFAVERGGIFGLRRAMAGKPSLRFSPAFVLGVLAAAVLVPLLASLGAAMALRYSLLASAEDAAADFRIAAAAVAAMDASGAEDAFRSAGEDFRDAQDRLSSAGFGALSLFAEMPLSSQLRTGKAFLRAGESLADAGRHLSRATGMLSGFSSRDIVGVFTGAPSVATPSSVAGFEGALESAGEALDDAADALGRIDADAIPEAYRSRLEQSLAALPLVRAKIAEFREATHAAAGIFGMRETRRYLILLQNASELRPTGGFIGNLAIVDVAGGRIAQLRVEDTYLFDGQLTRYTVPPKPIQDISRAWSLHDANWFRDFPTSAAIAARFFEEGGSATPDGVIAVTSRMIERMLGVIGPVTTPEGFSVDASSFTDGLNAMGASQRPGETTQARTVAAFLPEMLVRIGSLDADGRKAFSVAVRESLAAGDIQLWFRDEEEERLVKRLGFGGELQQTRGDTLAVVHANINGFKTDRVIEETVAHGVAIGAEGDIVDTVTVTRRHRGDERQESFYRRVNKDYLRVLAPRGSILLSAEGHTCGSTAPSVAYDSEGYRIDPTLEKVERSAREEDCVVVWEEGGFTAFGAWVFVSPGETATVRLSYRLPFRLEKSVDSYRLSVVKQPGWEPSVSIRLKADPSWRVAWRDDAFTEAGPGEFLADNGRLVRNRFYGIVFRRP